MMSQLDLLDLCFLTEEEKRSIKQVLQRDIDLQNNEKKRLQHVQKKMPNTRVKKKMTGEWFSSIKDHRYRGKPDGTELVWRSMTCERGSGTGLKSGQYQKEPRVPKQTDPSLERRVPLQSAIPAQLPEKNKQVVDKFGRQRRDEPVLLMKDHTANLQSEHPSLARKNPFGEADLTAGISSGTGQSDEESSEKENEWQRADPTKERDLAGMTRPLTDSKKQLAADQSEPYAHASRQQGEVTKMKNTLALMAQQSSEDDTRQLNRILGLNDFQVPDEKIKEGNKTAELSKPKISSPASDWGTGTKVGREEILQPKQIEKQKSSLPVNAQSASLAVNQISGPEKPRRLNREMDRSGVTKAGTVNPTAAPPTSRESKPWDENFFQGEGMKGSPDCASSAAIGLPGSVEYLEGNKANRSEDHKPVSGLKSKLSMDNPEFWTTPSPTDQKSELSHQGQRKALDEDFDYLVSSKKHEPLVDISTEMPSNDAPTWSATPVINRVDATEQVQKQTKSDLEYKLSPEKSMDIHSASLNPQTPEQVSMLIDFSDEHNSKPKANIIGTMSLKEKENASNMNTGPFNQDLAGIDAALPMQPIGHGIVDKPKTDKWPQREKDSISSREPSVMSSTNLEQQKKPFWDSQQMEISKTIKWDSKRSHSQDDVFNDANKFDSQQVRKGSLNDPYKIDIDPMMSRNQPPTWTEGMSVKAKVSAIERIIGHHDDGKYERTTKSNEWSDVPQRQSQEPIRSKPQTTILKSETPSVEATPVVEDLISAIKVVKKRNDAEDTLKNLYKMAAVGKVSPNRQQLFSAMGQSSKPEKMTDAIGYRAHPRSPRIQQILEHNVDQTAIPFPIPELPKDLFSKSKQKNKIDRYVDEDQKRVNKVNNSAKFDEPNLQNEVRPQNYVPHRRSQEPIRSKPETTILKKETPSIQPTPVVEELISAIKVEKKKNDAEAMLRNMYKMAAMGKDSSDGQQLFLAMGQSSQPVKKTDGKQLATKQKKLHSTSVKVEKWKVEEPIEEKGIVPHPSAGASQSLFLRAMQMKEKDVLSEKDEKDGFENRFSKKPRETTPLSDVPQRRSQELIRSKPQTAISKSNSPSIQPTPVVEELISAIKVEKKKNDAENMLRNLYKMAAVGKVSPNSQQLLSAMGQSSKPEKMTDTIGYRAHQDLPTIQQILEHIADQTAIPVPIPELPKDLFSKSKQKNKIDRYVDEDQKRVNKVNNSAKFNESTLQNEVRPQNDVPHRRSQEPIRSKPQTTISKRETPSIQPTPVVEELISAIKVEKKKNDAEAMLRNMYKMAAMGKVSPDSQPFFSAMGQTSQPVKKTYGKKLATEQKKLHSTSVKVEEPTKEKGIVPHPSAGASDSLFLRAMQMKEKDIVSGKDEKSGFENRFSRKPKETTPQNDVPHRRSQEPIRSKPQTTISKRETPSIQPTPVVEELISAIKVEKKKNDAENMLRNLYKMAAVGKVSPDSQQLLSAMGQSSKPEKMTDTIGYRAHQDLPTIQQILEHIADQTAIPVPIPELPKDLFSKSKQKNKIDRYVNEDQKRVNKVNNSAKFDESNLQNEVRPQHDVPHRRSQEPIRSKPQTTISKRETPSIQPTPVVEELISAIKVEKKKNDAEAMLRNMYKMAAMGKVSPDSQPFFSAMGQSSQPVKKTYGKKLATEQKKLHSTSVKVEESTKEKGIVPHPSAGASDSLNRRAMQMKEKDIVSGKDEKGGFENRFSKKPKATTPLNYVPQKRYQEPIRSETQPPISKSKTPSIQATPVVEELISEIKVVKKKNDAEDTLRKLYKMAAIGKDSRDGQQLFSAMGQHSKMLNTSNQADDETEMSFHEKDPELGNDYSESPFSRTLRTKRDHAAATKSDSTRKQGRGVIADATTSSKYAGEDVRIRSASSFENEDEPPHSQTCRDPVPRTWNQQVNASPIADGQNQNRMESPAFHSDAPIAHYSQPPPARPRKANVSNVPDVDDEVLTEHHASLQQRSAPRDVYDEQDSPASKMLARSKKKISRSLDDILESNSEDPGANAEKQRKQSDEPEDVNRWVYSTVERSEVGPAGHILAKGSNLPQAGKLSRSVPVLSPSDEEAESPDSWSESSQMSEKMPKRFGQAFSTSSAGSVEAKLEAIQISSSMMSLYSEAGDFGKLPITGEVEFSLRYNERGNELLVHVSRCRDLAPANEKKKRSDAYVKTYLLPDRSRQSKRKTVIKKKTLSPKYDEVLKYKIEKSDLANRILNLSVWHNDMFGRNVFLGEVNLILNSWDWTNQTLNWYSLQPKDFTIMEPIVSRGQLTLGLKYVPAKSLDGKKPASGEIHIWIQNAYNLVPVRSQGVDSFVKCYILPDTSRQSRQKTRVVRKNCNPEYNHTMVYDGFQAEDLNEACIELTIWDYERFSTNQFLGGVRLSFGKGTSYGKAVDWMDSQGEEIRLYKKLLETPNEWNQGILPLRPQMATAENPSK